MTKRPSIAWWALSGVAIGAFAVVRSWAYQISFWPLGAAAAASTLLAIALLAIGGRRRSAIPTPVLAVVVAAVALATGCGTVVAVALAMNTVVVPWSLLERPPWPGLRKADPSGRIPVVGLNVAAAVLAIDRDRSVTVPLVVLALAAVMCLVSVYLPSASRSIARGVDRAAHVIATIVTLPLLGLVWFFTALIPWLPQRLVRWDPTSSASRSGSTWNALTEQSPRPDRMWAAADRRVPAGAAERLRSLTASLLTAVILTACGVVIGTAVFSFVDNAGPEGPPEIHPVVGRQLESEPWWSDYNAAVDQMYKQSHLSQYVGLNLGDVTSEFLNISNGRRATWAPTGGACGDPVIIWMFGGSTTFGVGARDDHTLPSAISKAAAKKGIRLRIENFGVPGDVAWQENRRLAAALAQSSTRPDLVVFYDGFNDVETANSLGVSSRGEPGDYIGPLDRVQMAALDRLTQLDDGGKYVVDLPDGEDWIQRDSGLIARSAAEQYAFAHDEATRLLSTYDIPMVRFHQPSLRTRTEQVDGELPLDAHANAVGGQFVALLPDDVVDLSGLFNGDPKPVYADWVHLSESGNTVVAGAVLDSLLEQFPTLSENAGTPCS